MSGHIRPMGAKGTELLLSVTRWTGGVHGGDLLSDDALYAGDGDLLRRDRWGWSWLWRSSD